MVQSVLRNNPDKISGCLDVLRIRALVFEACSVHESSDMIANLGAVHVLANFHDDPGEVAAEDGAGLPVVVNIYIRAN